MATKPYENLELRTGHRLRDHVQGYVRARLNLQPARSHASHWRIGLLALSLASLLSGLAFGAEGKPLAVCKDGKTMTSTTGDHRGACSGHGGVARYLDGSPAPKGRTKSTSYR